MIDIESKIANFRKILRDYEKDKSEKALYRSTEVNDKKIKSKIDDMKKSYDNFVSKRKNLAIIRKNELISKNLDENKKDTLTTVQKLLDDLIFSIQNKLYDYSKTSEYKNKLKKEILESVDENMILYLKKDDLKIIDEVELEKDIDVEIMDDSYIGGYILSDKDKTFRINNTLRKKLEDKKYEIGKTLSQLLENEVNNIA
ncbi:MAG: V-type ATP synthase subunit E [Peptoniphilaceae bacterium]|nr:V-type ATP synthase subunit E [Peptoniphilaceae bacterium]MDD7383811.1 V-type ATP synthase subunit E [Peptoniphilaceae bacterium]MDY3737791.1 V-type ATP synthase subunit E [Peptoniphilaceae bacterium]